MEIYRPSAVGRTHICYRSAGDLFGYIPLVATETTYQASAIALTASEIWVLRQADLEQLILLHPDIQTPIKSWVRLILATPQKLALADAPMQTIKIVAVEPISSAVLSGQLAGRHDIQGIGAGFIPDILRTDLSDEIITVADDNAYKLGRQLAQEEGILSGISTGALLSAALQIAQRKIHENQLIVAIQASGGERYLSTPMWKILNTPPVNDLT